MDNGGGGDGEPMKGNSGITGQFAGPTRCAQCHANVHAEWSDTLHATALETLEEIGQDTNAACLPCHTVGYGQDGGFVNRATTDDLAGVSCESCHGAAADHANNVADESLRPEITISASVCGQCHTDEFHPNFEDWEMSRHAEIQESLKEEFFEGANASTCGRCHSGDVFIARLNGETVGNDYLKDVPVEELNPITCAVCHDPHERTGNAATPDDGRDYQLRFAQIKFAEPSTVIADVVNPDRFNLCGQCHHARERVWTDSSREPHPSDQVNVFFGEIPLPASDQTPIVPTRASVHLNTAEQCSTCHVFRKAAEEGIAPAVSGHTFEVNFAGCVLSGCHPSEAVAQAKFTGLESELETRVARVKAALDAWTADATRGNGTFWEYTSEGGPPAATQAKIPSDIKKARYLYYYVIQGGGNGVHNPDFVRDALIEALDYAENAGALLP